MARLTLSLSLSHSLSLSLSLSLSRSLSLFLALTHTHKHTLVFYNISVYHLYISWDCLSLLALNIFVFIVIPVSTGWYHKGALQSLMQGSSLPLLEVMCPGDVSPSLSAPPLSSVPLFIS